MKLNIAEFVRQVRQEVGRVTWSSRKELVLSTVMVLVMVTLASLFFLLTDSIIFNSVQFILGLGS